MARIEKRSDEEIITMINDVLRDYSDYDIDHWTVEVDNINLKLKMIMMLKPNNLHPKRSTHQN